MPSSIIAALAYIGAALGATGAAAAVVGGVVVGAVVGGAVSAIRGGNILVGALAGGILGGVTGGIGGELVGAGAGAAGAEAGGAAAVEGAAFGEAAGAGTAAGADAAATAAAAEGVSNIAGGAAAAEGALDTTSAGALTGGVTPAAQTALPSTSLVSSAPAVSSESVPWTYSLPAEEAVKTSASPGLLNMTDLSKAMALKSGVDMVGGLAKGYGESVAADDQMDKALAAKRVTPATTSNGKPLFTVNTTKADAQAMSYRNFFPTNDIPAVSAQKGSV